MKPGFKSVLTLALFIPLLVTAGCSMSEIQDSLPDQRLVYKKQREASENLEIPPDLTAGRFDDALDIPAVDRPTTFSEYAGGREQRQRIASQGDVLPQVQNVELKRRGGERWLEVQAAPQTLWPRLVAFWREQGILLTEQNPTLGVMRTDWLDNRAEIRKDFITRMVSKVAEGLYSTSTRDQYSLRIEEGIKPGTTEIRLTHRGMVERLVTDGIGDNSRTIWEPSGSDKEKEAEMLRRLMVYLGASQSRAAGSGTEVAATGQPVGANTRLSIEGGVPVILIPQEFRSAWRLTGTALDRAGFAVEDRDQTQGVYYVRYAGRGDPPPSDGKKPGLLSRLAFWRKKEVDSVKQYQVKVSGNATESRVTVLAADGTPDPSPNSQRILGLLQEQMH
ncbi:outer membrane protein assembly factor BamC [Thermochromatium tepidum]|uniref:Outer membrane protein assembly factor BamC n=1 Tax=Thermochromatium tepidum ATCC 43061 TaxID=316276 RepID=A0A6I6EG75_THETI|nr:outer membrane protein assembly factor BamC [Thermochromatium tepidum]QGU33949.1 outer membrane protein assembly factor BamC [Thermochromatium tepidum ATCC 43061]